MVVRVLAVGLEQVVVHVLHRDSVRTRSRPSASSSSMTSVPVASWVRVWSTASAISAPGRISPPTRCDAISCCATLRPELATGSGYPARQPVFTTAAAAAERGRSGQDRGVRLHLRAAARHRRVGTSVIVGTALAGGWATRRARATSHWPNRGHRQHPRDGDANAQRYDSPDDEAFYELPVQPHEHEGRAQSGVPDGQEAEHRGELGIGPAEPAFDLRQRLPFAWFQARGTPPVTAGHAGPPRNPGARCHRRLGYPVRRDANRRPARSARFAGGSRATDRARSRSRGADGPCSCRTPARLGNAAQFRCRGLPARRLGVRRLGADVRERRPLVALDGQVA